MAQDYSGIGLDSNLIALDSPLNNQGSATTGFQFRTQSERGLIKPFHAGTLYALSNAGTISPIAVGSKGSGTETLIVTSTLSNTLNNRLLATHEMDFYQGNPSVGTGRLFGEITSVPFANFTVMHWNSWGASNQLNIVAKNVVRNESNSLATVSCIDQWRFLIPPGGAR